MNIDECRNLSVELESAAWNNYFKIESLKGYCENKLPDPVASTMMVELLDEIGKNALNIVKQFDSYTMNIEKHLIISYK